MSYSYYAKYQIGPKGKYTKDNIRPRFQYNDLNPRAILEGEGIYQIQGSISFNNKINSNYTYIVIGIYHKDKLKLQVKQIRKRSILNKKNLVIVINNKNLTKRDLEVLSLYQQS